ncbi:MAG: DEAD/DEAH box helicase [Myxococcaceae bacterium]
MGSLTSPTPAETTFEALGLPAPLLEALTRLGYEEPTPIQREAIPPLLAGKDVLGQAATGTGKTAAFALPLLSRLNVGVCDAFQTSALVLVPTRELAMQVAEAVQKYGSALGVSVVAIYGGQDISQQFRRLKRGVDVVVATPGRAIDHLKRKTLSLERVGTVVLDEADEMLDMGFADELEEILAALPEKRQSALFSATLPHRIARIAEKHLHSPVRINIARAHVSPGDQPQVRQSAYVVPRAYKGVALARILEVERPQSALVFCRTRDEVDELAERLADQGFRAEALHGGLNQEQRDRVMKRFKSHDVELLVATDVAARGLHIESLSHVVNYDVPNAPDAYVHRIGRTGRAGKEGVAITLAEPSEVRFLHMLEKAGGAKIALLPVPNPKQLRELRLQDTQAAVREATEAGELDEFRALAEALSLEAGGIEAVAAAALKLLHQGRNPPGPGDEVEIPASEARPSRAAHGERGSRHPGAAPRGAHQTGGARKGGARQHAGRAGPESASRLFIGAGSRAGIRPADLVGAIANEAGVDSKNIRVVEIREPYSLVEVPSEVAGRVITALSGTTLRGRKVQVRLERS